MDHIRKVMERMVVENGTDIIKIDDEPDGMYFLESGMAVCLNREGEQINLMHEGQYFGEYGVLSGQKRLSTIRSVGRTIVYKIGTEDFNEIIREHPDIYGKLMKKVWNCLKKSTSARKPSVILISYPEASSSALRSPGL